MKAKTFHLSTETPFRAACGYTNTVEPTGHSLTGTLSRVSCPACRKYIRPEAIGKHWPNREKRVLTP